MITYTNEDYQKNQMSSARRWQVAGIVCLAFVFLFSCPIYFLPNLPQWVILLAYPFLILGFPLWTIGNNRVKALKRGPRANLLLDAELKALNDKYSIHHYVTVGGKLVKHLLVSPTGVLAIETRDTLGPVSCSNDKWTARRSLFERIAGGRSNLGDPTRDLNEQLPAVREFLASFGKPDVPAKGLVVFTRTPEIGVEGCTYPTIPLGEARLAIRSMLSDTGEREEGASVRSLLTTDDRRKLNAKLAPAKATTVAKPAPAKRKTQ